jgi:ferredoxin
VTLDEAIKHAEEVAEEQDKAAKEWHENQVRKCELIRFAEMDYTHENKCKKCASEHRQLAEWLKELKTFKTRKGEWLRMSDLSEQEDDRYKCSRCGNVIHYKNKMDLYTFNSWCGRCGSDNGRHINYEVEK